MSHLNKKKNFVTNITKEAVRTQEVSPSGVGVVYKSPDELALYKLVCSSLVGKDTYYKSSDKNLEELRNLCSKVSREYICRLAAYARNEMSLRAIPVVLWVEAARKESQKGEDKGIVRRAAPYILKRADDGQNAIAYYLNTNEGSKKNLPNSIKKGISDVAKNYGHYQLSKYKNTKKEVSMQDLANICHVKPSAKVQEDWKNLMENTISPPETWEVNLSAAGDDYAKKIAAWNNSIPNMGLLAIVRNLRNMIQAEAYDALDIARERIESSKEVEKSKILPFQWYSAFNSLGEFSTSVQVIEANKVKESLSKAMANSCLLLPNIKGKSLFVLDDSGSMTWTDSVAINGCLLSAVGSMIAEEFHFSLFASSYRKVSPRDLRGLGTNPYEFVESIKNKFSSGGTDHSCIFKGIKDEKYDNIFIFTDEVPHYNRNSSPENLESYIQFRKKNQNTNVFVINLAGSTSGIIPTKTKNFHVLSGFSPRVFEFVDLMKNPEDAVRLVSESYSEIQ